MSSTTPSRGENLYGQGPILAVAPMIDWTDRACRYLHRLLSQRALLYTEMVVADAVLHGPRDRLLGHDPAEHPVALAAGRFGSGQADGGGADRAGFRL